MFTLKQHVFVFQTQFVIVLIHTIINIINQNECDFPQFLNYIVVGYALSLIVLFSNFFYQAYIVKNKKASKRVATANGYSHFGHESSPPARQRHLNGSGVAELSDHINTLDQQSHNGVAHSDVIANGDVTVNGDIISDDVLFRKRQVVNR